MKTLTKLTLAIKEVRQMSEADMRIMALVVMMALSGCGEGGGYVGAPYHGQYYSERTQTGFPSQPLYAPYNPMNSPVFNPVPINPIGSPGNPVHVAPQSYQIGPGNPYQIQTGF